jgi:hypothetical protein
MDQLQERCEVVLDDETILEEDKIEKVEEIVHELFGSELSNSDKERFVLDILWQHRDKSKRTPAVRKAKARVVRTTASTKISEPVAKPPPSDPSKLEKPKPVAPVNKAAPAWEDWNYAEQTQDEAMSPFDILRRILGEENRDEDIQHALEKNEYDLEATLNLLMSGQEISEGGGEQQSDDHQKGTNTPSPYNISRNSPFHDSRSPVQEKVMCKYFVQFGECLRADCKYSHDLSSRICRFWLKGGCLAGDDCAFLHEIPQPLLDQWSIREDKVNSEQNQKPQTVPLTDDEFPALGQKKRLNKNGGAAPKPLVYNPTSTFVPSFMRVVDAFTPAPSTPSKKVVASKPALIKPTLTIKKALNRTVIAISEPKHVPWVETEYGVNEVYVSHRLAALRHGEMRNKYLQLAAESWHKNDGAAARLLSKKGQKHNDLMIEEYSSASDALFEYRYVNRTSEIYIDLHGMELEDSVDRLHEVLVQIEEQERDHPRPVYAISGSGHHFSRNKTSEDKLSKHIKDFLNSKGYEWKEFRTKETKFGKLIGVDPWSHI